MRNKDTKIINLESLAQEFSRNISPHQTNFNNTKTSKYFSKKSKMSGHSKNNLTVTSNASTIRIDFGTLLSTNSNSGEKVISTENNKFTPNISIPNKHIQEIDLDYNENLENTNRSIKSALLTVIIRYSFILIDYNFNINI